MPDNLDEAFAVEEHDPIITAQNTIKDEVTVIYDDTVDYHDATPGTIFQLKHDREIRDLPKITNITGHPTIKLEIDLVSHWYCGQMVVASNVFVWDEEKQDFFDTFIRDKNKNEALQFEYPGAYVNFSDTALDLEGRLSFGDVKGNFIKCPRRYLTRAFKTEYRKRWMALNYKYYVAERKARKLLRALVTRNQWRMYMDSGFLPVEINGERYELGGYNGAFLIKPRRQGPDRLFKEEIIEQYCLHARDKDIPQSDVVTMQMLHLIAVGPEKFRDTANTDLHKGHPDYDSSKDVQMLSKKEFVKVVIERNGGIDFHNFALFESSIHKIGVYCEYISPRAYSWVR